MSITIPNIFITHEDEGEIIAVPVIINYVGPVRGMQMAIKWPAEQFNFDTLIFGPHDILPNSLYGVNFDSQVRVIMRAAPGESTFSFQDDSVAFTLYLEAKKYNGFANIEIDQSFHTAASDEVRDPIPISIGSPATVT